MAKTVSKKKVVSKKKAASKTGSDLIMKISNEVENLGFEKAEEAVIRSSKESGIHIFRLGGALSVIQSNGWYKQAGYPQFKAYVEEKFALKHARARYFIQIYRKVIEMGLNWAVVERIGWTKFRVIMPILTKSNLKMWLKKADKLTYNTLEATVKKAKQGAPVDSDENITTLSFKVHDDQLSCIEEALTQAGKDSESDVKAVQLTSVAMAFNGGPSAPPAKQKTGKGIGDLKATVAANDYQAVLTMVESVYPHVVIKDVDVYDKTTKPDTGKPPVMSKKKVAKKTASKKKVTKKKAAPKSKKKVATA